MRVDELRELLGRHEAAALRQIAVELYKAVPKASKTSYMDSFLQTFTPDTKVARRKAEPVSFGEVALEVESFIEDADAGFYFAPNRIVPKAQRSKWRFTARRLIKGLLAARGEDGEEAAVLLMWVYDMLCHACGVYIFPTDSPFSAIGQTQPELLELALSRLFLSGINEERVRLAVYTTVDGSLDRETHPLSPELTLVACLKTNPARELAREVAARFDDDYPAYLESKQQFKNSYENSYSKEYRHNRAVYLHGFLSLALREPEAGIAHYQRHFQERNPEVKLYCLLYYLLGGDDLAELWLREYDRAVAAGVKPRRQLVEEYQRRLAAKAG
ncbi:MAG: hypothetical protein LBL55_09395 [Propionibacteriaceae bacterium]|jgi:hypothetical protein|nr:hypothetical protein [Propionibacteriaceae bacterium]